jgi:hypothetical protein
MPQARNGGAGSRRDAAADAADADGVVVAAADPRSQRARADCRAARESSRRDGLRRGRADYGSVVEDVLLLPVPRIGRSREFADLLPDQSCRGVRDLFAGSGSGVPGLEGWKAGACVAACGRRRVPSRIAAAESAGVRLFTTETQRSQRSFFSLCPLCLCGD